MRLELEPVFDHLHRLLHPFLVQPELSSDAFYHFVNRGQKYHRGQGPGGLAGQIRTYVSHFIIRCGFMVMKAVYMLRNTAI
jgi:hypothetical protein